MARQNSTNDSDEAKPNPWGKFFPAMAKESVPPEDEHKSPCVRCVRRGRSELCVSDGQRKIACRPCRQGKEGCSWVKRIRMKSKAPYKRNSSDEDELEEGSEKDFGHRSRTLRPIKRRATPWPRTNARARSPQEIYSVAPQRGRRGNDNQHSEALKELTDVLKRVAVAAEAIQDVLKEMAERAEKSEIAPEKRLDGGGKERLPQSAVPETPEAALAPSNTKGKRKAREMSPIDISSDENE